LVLARPFQVVEAFGTGYTKPGQIDPQRSNGLSQEKRAHRKEKVGHGVGVPEEKNFPGVHRSDGRLNFGQEHPLIIIVLGVDEKLGSPSPSRPSS
jgi:hypothetical protein